jgi:hypothetical protein
MGKKSRKVRRNRQKATKVAAYSSKEPEQLKATEHIATADNNGMMYADYQHAARIVINFLSNYLPKKSSESATMEDLIDAAQQVTAVSGVVVETKVMAALAVLIESHASAQEAFREVSGHNRCLLRCWSMVRLLLGVSSSQEERSPTAVDGLAFASAFLSKTADSSDSRNKADDLNDKSSKPKSTSIQSETDVMNLPTVHLVGGDDWFRSACFILNLNR